MILIFFSSSLYFFVSFFVIIFSAVDGRICFCEYESCLSCPYIMDGWFDIAGSHPLFEAAIIVTTQPFYTACCKWIG